MKPLVRFAPFFACLAFTGIALAGLSKSEVKKEAQAAGAAASAGIKTSCGCDVTIGFEWGDFEKMKTDAYTSESKPRSWKNNFVGDAQAAKGAAEALCKTPAAKAKFCSMKKVTIVGKGISEASFSFDAGAGAKVFTSEQAMLGDAVTNKIKQALDIAAPDVGTLSKADVKELATAEGVTASKAIKSSCGCELPVGFEWGDFSKMTTTEHDSESKPRSWKNNFVGEANGIASAAGALCTSASMKKKFCGLKKFTIIGKGVSETDFKATSAGVQVFTSEQAQLGSIVTDRIKSVIDP